MPITRRLADKIERDFPEDHATIQSMLQEVENGKFKGDASERVLTAAIVVAQGDVDRFIEALRLMEIDWRDLLMAAGLGHEGWPSKVDDFLNSDAN
jgi:hypothetical protein